MADRGVDLAALPKEVREQLAELELELSEGKRVITLTLIMFNNINLLFKSQGRMALKQSHTLKQTVSTALCWCLKVLCFPSENF